MIRLIVALVLMGGASTYYTSTSETYSPEKEEVIQQAVYLAMSQAHLKPLDVNDSFSERVFAEFLESMDGRKRFFTQDEIDQLSKYKYEIDDLFKDANLAFFNEVVELVDVKIRMGATYYQEILDQPFDFDKDESIEIDFEKQSYAKDDAALKARWQHRLKYYTLQELRDKLEAQEKMSPDSIKSRSELELVSRGEVKEAYDRWYENYERVRRSDRFEQYINVIMRQYDPHSAYFSPKGKQDFDMRMGGKLEGIGAQLSNKGEFTQVVTIVPGGPVWKDDRLEVNDLITKVAQDGEDAVDITGMRVDDVVTLIRGPKGTKVTLTIQKKDESLMEVTIVRDVINLEIARARGAMISQDESDQKYGYIDLPMFYNSFDGPDGNSSAKDVAVLIDSLKDQGMDGLILDLRDNLGGALIDAIDISGLFIEEGPVVQVKSRDRKPYVHNDSNEDVHYNGPLLVLVNSFSASASEIVAGALQDYGRAIVVGNQSFGKGTVQNFIDLDRVVRTDASPLGQIKLTIQKYYRVNGASTQLNGVIPDITLPDTYDLLPTGERENKRALAWSKIQEVEFGQNVLTYDDRQVLHKKSEARVANHPSFAAISDYAKWLKDNKDMTVVPISIDKYEAYLDQVAEHNEAFDKRLDTDVEGMMITPVDIKFDSEITEEEKEARAEAWQKSVLKDFYLEEASNIIKDILVSDWYAALNKAKGE
jgi:C-terminal peptidase (prc)